MEKLKVASIILIYCIISALAIGAFTISKSEAFNFASINGSSEDGERIRILILFFAPLVWMFLTYQISCLSNIGFLYTLMLVVAFPLIGWTFLMYLGVRRVGLAEMKLDENKKCLKEERVEKNIVYPEATIKNATKKLVPPTMSPEKIIAIIGIFVLLFMLIYPPTIVKILKSKSIKTVEYVGHYYIFSTNKEIKNEAGITRPVLNVWVDVTRLGIQVVVLLIIFGAAYLCINPTTREITSGQ